VFVRKVPAIVLTAGLLVSLSACTGLFPETCTPSIASGSNSDLVSAVGSFGKDPRASFPTPLISEAPEVSELTVGEGDVAGSGDIVDFQVTVLLGRTGEVITSSSYDETSPVRRTVDSGDPLGDMLACSSVGSRVAATSTFENVFPDTNPETSGAEADDTIVLVFDVQRVLPGRANGVDQLAPSGFPSIALAPNGQPGFTFASGDVPTESSFGVLKQGSGAVVEEGESAVIHVSGIVWDAATVAFSTWSTGAPINVAAADVADDPNGLPPGWANALIGQKVGSQIIATITPADGYAPGTAPTGVTETDTIVVVFDILGLL